MEGSVSWQKAILLLVIFFIPLPSVADEKEKNISASIEQAINSYKILYSPPGSLEGEIERLIDIGPTVEEARENKVAESKRKYAAKRSVTGEIVGQSRPRRIIWNGGARSLNTNSLLTDRNTVTDRNAEDTSEGINYGY